MEEIDLSPSKHQPYGLLLSLVYLSLCSVKRADIGRSTAAVDCNPSLEKSPRVKSGCWRWDPGDGSRDEGSIKQGLGDSSPHCPSLIGNEEGEAMA